MARVLVIRGGAIGDFILTLPALRLLQENIPDCQLEVLGYPGIADLAVKAGLAQTTRSISDPRLALLFAKNATFDPALIEYFTSFNLIVSYLFDPDGILRDNLTRLGVKTLLDSPQRIVSGAGHASEQLARPLQKLAMFLEEPDWRRPTFPTVPQRSPRIAIHTGSGSLSKNWPLTHWQRLITELQEKHPEHPLVGIVGEAELERGSLPENLPLWQNLPLTELATRLSDCQLFLGHDSGIAHLASACGVPSLLLFGPTDPNTWAPPQKNIRLLRAPAGDLKLLPYEVVRDTVFSLLT